MIKRIILFIAICLMSGFAFAGGGNSGGPSSGGSGCATTGCTYTGQVIQSTNGAASTPPLGLTGTWFTGGSSTSTKPQLLIEPSGNTSASWSTSGTGLGVNAPSSFSGNLADFQINGTSIVKFLGGSNGGIYFSNPTTGTGAPIQMGTQQFGAALGNFWFSQSGTNVLTVEGSGQVGWISSGTTVGENIYGIGGVVEVSNSGSAGSGGKLIAAVLGTRGAYTVSTLPTGTAGDATYVTDAVACTFLSSLTGGGSTVCPVFYNGSAWIGG